jgi:hypothetical protein
MTTFTVFAIFRIVQAQALNVKEDSLHSPYSAAADRASPRSPGGRVITVTRARASPAARIVSLQMAEHGFGNFQRSFAMREMTNAIEEQAGVAAGEEAVQSLR